MQTKLGKGMKQEESHRKHKETNRNVGGGAA